MKVELNTRESIAITMADVGHGDFAVIINGAFEGWIVVREQHGPGFLALTPDGRTEGFGPLANHKVRVLQPGEVIKIII